MEREDTSNSDRPGSGLHDERTAGQPLKIFINYRHDDQPFAAQALYRELSRRFGNENIFFDGGTLRPGTQFLGETEPGLTDGGAVFIALIGPGWMPTMIERQQRGDEDYVTSEIEVALRKGWIVIPVVVDDASLPDPLALPPSIKALSTFQAARLRQTSLDNDLEELITRLEEIRHRLQIFISYRRDDLPFAAEALYRGLSGRFGSENIFFDQDTLRPGTQFLEEMASHLNGRAGAFLAVIGSRWLPSIMRNRQQGGEDYVVKEIELALQTGWTVIQVLVDDASLPDPLELPAAISALPDNQAVRLRQTSFDDDIANLSALLNELSARATDAVTALEGASTGEVGDRATARDSEPVETFADDEHYRSLIDEADNLVIFLGADANSDDHEGPFREGSSMLPDDADLAKVLAARARLATGERELAEVAQYARLIRGEPNVSRWIKQAVAVDSEPDPVHRYLAGFPNRLEQLGLEKRYQMIVTSKFDVALEQALRREGEPFDVAIYMAAGTEYAGRFVHLAWDSSDARPILAPNEYGGFPFRGDYGELARTVIVRINGVVDDATAGYRWKNNLIVTEDHYIDYLGGRAAHEVVPTQILAKLRQSSCLFLGYELSDWRLRVFLHWIWQGETLGMARNWAVERNPDVLERRFWQNYGVSLYPMRLTDYVQRLERFLLEHSSDLT